MPKKDYTTMTIKKELYEQFKQFCDEHGYNVSKLISLLIIEKLKKEANGSK